MGLFKPAKILIFLMIPLLVPVLSIEDGSITIIKCCKEDFILRKNVCIFDDGLKLTVPVYESDHVTRDDSMKVNFVYYPVKCVEHEKEAFILQPQFSPSESFFMQNDGRLWVPALNTSLTNLQFCLDHHEGLGLIARICISGLQADSEGDEVSKGIAMIGMAISLPFLLATFVIYALLPERTLYGMCLMCYVFSLFWAYFIGLFCFIYVKFGTVNLLTCRIIAMCMYFFLVASIVWMNVVAIDIWLTFSGYRGHLSNEKKRFWKYSVYAWGVPLLMVILINTLAYTVSLTAWYLPFGEQECVLTEGIPELLYFYGPMGILIATNIGLFIGTAWKIIKTRGQTAMLRRDGNNTHRSENEAAGRIKVYVKLLFAMGINWSVEFIQWAIAWQVGDVPFLWYLTDLCNAGLGVFIFFMFVFNRNTWKLLKKRYYMVTGKPDPTLRTTSPIRNTSTTTSRAGI